MRTSLIYHRVATMDETYEPIRVRKLLTELKAEEATNATCRRSVRESDERLVHIHKAIDAEREASR